MTAAPKAPAIRSSCDGKVAKRRPAVRTGKANVPREETGDSTLGAAGVGVPARREGRQRLALGRAFTQQGLAATCKDLSNKGGTRNRKEGKGLAHESVCARKKG